MVYPRAMLRLTGCHGEPGMQKSYGSYHEIITIYAVDCAHALLIALFL